MAFKVWIDDGNVTTTNLLSESDFNSNSDRVSGFKPGSAASAKNVNSAIRQANLIAVALMQSMGITTLNLNSSVNAVKTAIDSYFTNAYSRKLDTTGDGKDVRVTFTQGTTGSLTSSSKLSTLFGTLAAWCASFGSLAKKSIIDSQDIKNGAIKGVNIGDGAITTRNFSNDAKAPFAEKTSFSGTSKSATVSGYTATISGIESASLLFCSMVYLYERQPNVSSGHRISFLTEVGYNNINYYETSIGVYNDEATTYDLIVAVYIDSNQIVHFELKMYKDGVVVTSSELNKFSIGSIRCKVIQ